MGRREEGREGGGAFPGETGPQDVHQEQSERRSDWRLVLGSRLDSVLAAVAPEQDTQLLITCKLSQNTRDYTRTSF